MAKKKQEETFEEKITTVEFSDEMSTSYIDYAMSVIVARAIPDARDGLKPVQRRILYAMRELGLRNDGPFKKSARIVGDTMGKYHPHGDSSIYEAMVNLSKEWSLNHPLVSSHGNFGSIEGDGAAAMRYTEAKLSGLSEEVYLSDLDKHVIDFVPNFDESEKEPEVLPVRVPNLLITGAEGIAVGMACKIPTHNLGEVLDATVAYISNPKITTEGLMEYVKGPDFATGGIIANASDLPEIYATGQGKVRVRGKVEIEEGKNGKTNIVVTEIPYTMIGAIDKFMSDIADMVRNKVTGDIVDIRNNSDKDGIRIVVELRKGADVERNVNLLYKKCRLEDTFGVNMLAVLDKKPVLLSLKDAIKNFVIFQIDINTKKYEYLLEKELDKKEVKEGLMKAYDVIDLIIEILRGSKNLKDAKACLIEGITDPITFKHVSSEKEAKELRFTERQATAILEMRLQKLIGLELDILKKEYDETLKNIKTYEGLLNSPTKMKNKIQSELKDIKKKYDTPRKTVIEDSADIVIKKEEIKEQDYYVVIDRFRYVKAFDEQTYQRNIANIENDFRTVLQINNLDRLCIFTDSGKLHKIKVLDIPVSKYKDKGIPVENISNCTSEEELIYVDSFENIKDRQFLFASSKGMVKRVNGAEFDATKKTIDSTKLPEDTKIINISVVEENNEVILGTKNGFYIRFKANEVSELKKTAVGVRGIKLKEDDNVILCAVGDTKSEFMYDETPVQFTRVKPTKRDGQGTKIRL